MGKYKLLFLAIPLLAAGCSKAASEHGADSNVLYEGGVETAEYHLTGGKTVVIDNHGEPHDIEGFPMLFRKPVEVASEGIDEFRIEIIRPTAEEMPADAQPPAPEPASEQANPYE